MAAVDEVSQAERRRLLANDRRVSTYREAAQASIDDFCGGRYATIGKPTVTGTAPISYPRQPEGSPWASDPTGDEPPTGVDINAIEPVGEKHEQEEKPKSEFVRHGWRRL